MLISKTWLQSRLKKVANYAKLHEIIWINIDILYINALLVPLDVVDHATWINLENLQTQDLMYIFNDTRIVQLCYGQ